MFPVLPLVQVRSGALAGRPASRDVRADLAALARSAGEVVLVDLDGLASNAPDLELLRDVSRRNAVWADCGSRTADDVVELFVAGASRATVRWALLRDAGELEEVADIADPGAVYLGLEFREAFVANPREPRVALEDALALATKLALPVVVLDVTAAGDARRQLGAFAGERWYAAPLPRDELAPLADEGWTGAIGLPAEEPA